MNLFHSVAAASVISLAGVLAAVPVARAHATFERSETPADSTQRMVLRIPHGCDGQATHTVRVSLPEGALDVKPMPKPGWTLSIVKGPFAKTYRLYGEPVSEGPREIVWSKGELPNEFYDEFVFRMRLPGELAGRTIPVPVVQECAAGRIAWTEVAAPGQDAHALKHPAPTIRVVAAAVSRSFKAGGVVVERPWARATPAGAKVGGGYFTIRNTGPAPDRLIGIASAIAGRGEVHEMAMADGVMKMREMKALEIPAGGSVELKPGGFHVMFIDLKEGLVEGKRVKARLSFEKAGPLDVEFDVAPAGAAGAPDDHSHH